MVTARERTSPRRSIDGKLLLPPDAQGLVELAAALQNVGDLANGDRRAAIVARGPERGLRLAGQAPRPPRSGRRGSTVRRGAGRRPHAPVRAFGIAGRRRADRRGENSLDQVRVAQRVRAFEREAQEIRPEGVASGKARNGRRDQRMRRARLALCPLEPCGPRQNRGLQERPVRLWRRARSGRLHPARVAGKSPSRSRQALREFRHRGAREARGGRPRRSAAQAAGRADWRRRAQRRRSRPSRREVRGRSGARSPPAGASTPSACPAAPSAASGIGTSGENSVAADNCRAWSSVSASR